jgi:hypothetical protein
MSKELINEELKVLEELIRTASQHLTGKDSYSYLQSKDLRDRLYGEHPDCYISLKRMGRIGRNTAAYMLPLCNRAAILDPKVINISIKVIKRLMKDTSGMYDVNDLKTILAQLQRKHSVYSKEVPKPPNQAGRKAVITRMMNNIKGHLMVTRKQ